MKKKILFLISALTFALLCTVNIQAKGVIDATLWLDATSSNATVSEMPLPPDTYKSLSGSYLSQDALGASYEKNYKGSIAWGQLHVTVTAPAHYESVNSYYGYYADGVYMGTKVAYWKY